MARAMAAAAPRGRDVVVKGHRHMVNLTAPEVVNALSQEIVKAIQSPDLNAKFTQQGLEVAPLDALQFGPFVRDESQRWGRVIQAASIKLE